MSRPFQVSVPASSGNLGPGFDVLGLALTLRSELSIRVLPKNAKHHAVHLRGEGSDFLPRNKSNVILKTIAWVFKRAHQPMPMLELECHNRIPLTRGMGSSSAAYLCALLAANRLLKNKYSHEQILNWATQLEGHPDNVAPALLGGVRASAVLNGNVISTLLPSPKTKLVLAIPHFELSTKLARKVIPKKIGMKDAISNLAAVSLMPLAFQKKPELLKELLNDRWHEPYRAKLVPGFYSVKKAALGAGAYGVILSGAGPTMLSFVSPKKVNNVAQAMKLAFLRAGVKSRTLILGIDKRGAVVK